MKKTTIDRVVLELAKNFVAEKDIKGQLAVDARAYVFIEDNTAKGEFDLYKKKYERLKTFYTKATKDY